MSTQGPDGGELDPETRALLAEARGMDEPSDQQRSRVLRGLEVSLAAAATTTATTAWASSSLAAATKVVVVTVTVGLASTGVWFARRSAAPEERPRAALVAKPATPSEVTPAVPQLEPEAAPEQPLEAAAQDAQVPSEPELRPHTRRAHRHKAQASLHEETALLREVHAAIGRGDGKGALELLARYERRFKSGLLREEKSAARVLALCAEDRKAEARVAASRFVQRYPHSPQVARLQASCAADAVKGAP